MESYDNFNTLKQRDVQVIEELDDILATLPVLTRKCEKRKLHMSTHALKLASELVLHCRDYILNACSTTQQHRF